jgi:hypothetical protein
MLAAGDLVVADANNARVLRVRPSTGGVVILAPPLERILEAPSAIVATDQGRIYVVDASLQAIVEIDPVGFKQSLLLTPGGEPVRATHGLAVDARGVLYAWDPADGLVRIAPAAGYRWRRTVLSDFDRPLDFRVGGLAATRDADGLVNEIFIAASVVVGDDPSAIWRVDAATRQATTIPATEDQEARYYGVVARGDCKALACSVVYSRCEDNPGILDGAGTLETFGIIGVIPILGTLYDGFDSLRCTYGLAPGATADEHFVGTMLANYSEGRVERVAGSPAMAAVIANLPRGPFDNAPLPIALARVIRPDPIAVPEAGAGATAALAALAALAQRRTRPRPARPRASTPGSRSRRSLAS